MMKKTTLLFSIMLCLAISINAFSDKKPITFADYDHWKSIQSAKMSNDGNWVSYEINPQEGDGFLYLYEVETQKLDSFPRGYSAQFSSNCNYLAFKIKAKFADVREAKLKKKKRDQMPKDSLAIYIFNSNELEKTAKIKSFNLPKENSDWFAYTYTAEIKKDTTKKKEKSKKKKDKSKGNDFKIYNPINKQSYSYKNVTEYTISEYGQSIAFIQIEKDSIEISKVLNFTPKNEETSTLFEEEGKSKKLSINNAGENIAFLFSADTTKTKIYNLYFANKNNEAKLLIDMNNEAMPKDWSVSENGNITFNKKGNRFYFGIAPKPLEPPKDTLTADEKVSIDIWNWKDNYLQPQQLLNRKREENKTYLAAFDLSSKKMIQIADEKINSVSQNLKGPNKYAIAYVSDKYGKFLTWEGKQYSDIYLVDLKTGQRTLIKRKLATRPELSPSEKYILWYNSDELGYNVYDIEKNEIRNITKNIKTNFWDELDDHPNTKPAYGTAGWSKDDKSVLIYDHYDIWKVDLSGKKEAINLTNTYGKENQMIFRYIPLDETRRKIEEKNLLLSAFNEITKQSGFFTINNKNPQDPDELIYGNYSFIGRRGANITKAKNTDDIIFRKGNLQMYPEIYVSKLDFESAKKISNTNPQQKDFNWATVELVHWTSLDGKELDGLLYKPENFDPSKKYPMMIYFYEIMSNRRFNYITPSPSRSSINIIHFVSNGYLVFIPDIVYKDGYPGESSVNSVVAGATYLIDNYSFVNKDKIGIQGQSWGGYQVAYLVTQTNLFAAAWAGAPVSNMTSAYGGIRWGSGMNRAFQYERTQSRIGGSLWEKPLLYIENSPLFLAEKINTPLAIMHNDKDGAVPWYQGIELFCGLRRLQKPVWLLCYNGAPHNLRRRADSKDISIRLSQFFDHFLKDEPAPVWLEYGVPAVKKGKEFGFELVK